MSAKQCKDCENPLEPDAVYCGRCGAGVRQIPVGCAIVGVIFLLAAAFVAFRILQSAIG